jgi:hypothetical protein
MDEPFRLNREKPHDKTAPPNPTLAERQFNDWQNEKIRQEHAADVEKLAGSGK